ncbi:MAG: methionine gamma-lyase family protein, partial [bacterium]|nr:methionine gamma-lyase family protein [bacterium]
MRIYRIDDVISVAEEASQGEFRAIEKITYINQGKILAAFQSCRVSEYHMYGSTGYGYDDAGREIIEKVYANVFQGESALVRGQFASGTHALSCALFALLRPGDELIIATGLPYHTLQPVIGINSDSKSSLKSWGITYKVVPTLESGGIDLVCLAASLSCKTKAVHVQRSRGYSWRRALTLADISEVVALVKAYDPKIAILVDNCYGEFVFEREPLYYGVDLIAGSLIKNPGGGLALSGGYVVGRSDLVDLAAEQLYAPGIGGKVGASIGYNRGILQGLFNAPTVVEAALKGATLLAHAGGLLGLEISPEVGEIRG